MQRFDDRDNDAVTALRVLAVDEVEQAKSGHPGLPLGASPMAYVVWSRFLRFDSTAPDWPDRDRFVLSAGHGSAMLYALLHLFGFDLPLAELKRFRQWGSRTPGHPEHGLTPGVETTTGPLGQGLATAVGMALAERHLAAVFNREGFPIVDHRTFVLVSDGDLMEGISHEAASLAGHLRLDRLVVLYDDNRITIDGPTPLALSDDAERRFSAYGWRTLHIEDGNDLEGIAAALDEAVAGTGAPTLIRVRTHIGYGAPHKQDTAAAHGSPLGPEEAAATKRALGWAIDEPFLIPDAVRAHFRGIAAERAAVRSAWTDLFASYRAAHPELAAELERRLAGKLPEGWEQLDPGFADAGAMATREASGKMLNALAPHLPELIGGSADLTPSNDTALKGEEAIEPGVYGGRYIHFGVREHAMGAICNGLSLHGGLRPYAGTFLIFSDYMRPSVRLAALMGQPVVFVYTHDSVGLGEDGPTHQPVGQIVALRAIPNVAVIRPADARETAAAWRIALTRRHGPTALVLTRQKLPMLTPPPPGAVARGAYVKAEAGGGVPDVVLIATGSEVALALAARERLEREGVSTRVVSAPCLELFKEQDVTYQREVLGPGGALRVALEAGRGLGWHRWVGDGELIVLSRFGASAPGEIALHELGFSPENVVERVQAARRRRQVARLRCDLPTVLDARRGEALSTLQRSAALSGISARSSTLWGERYAPSVVRRLGWLDLPGRMTGSLHGLRTTVERLAAHGASTLYLLGMGGSSLAPQVLRSMLGNPSGREIVVLDTTDPERVGAELDRLAPESAAVVAISKSGTTAETSALLEIMWERLASRIEKPGSRFVAITEPGTPLARIGAERGFSLMPHPVDVGGRYSALSVVGVFPALWLGHDVEALLAAGATGLGSMGPDHAACQLAAALGAIAPSGWGRVVWCASPRLAPLGRWAEQLVAESTGKEGRGILPVPVAWPPPAETVWPHTLFLSPRFAGETTAELDVALDALASAGAPVVRWELEEGQLGQAFTVLETATALTGLLLGINPFDEPDVVRAKERARAALTSATAAVLRASPDPGTELIEHVAAVGPDDAVALLAYLPERPGVETSLDALAAALSHRLRAPVTAAFGPRYLHSTGQLHKGGPDHLVPIVLTTGGRRDVEIPGQSFTLGQLRAAQAIGDIEALREVGRNVLHLHLEEDVPDELDRMSAALR
jgi:transketolase